MNSPATNSTNPQPLRCWAEVNLAALQHNAAVVRKQVGAKPRIMAIIKGNAYGHGAERCAAALEDCVDAFGVANLTEAQLLPTKLPVYILSPPLPTERRDVIEAGFTPFVSSLDEARAYADLKHPGGANIHLMIDTGMGRMGVNVDAALATARGIVALGGVNLSGICTHLPVADEDKVFTCNQLEDYQQLVNKIAAIAPDVHCSHLLNSAGVINFPQVAADMVRPGLMLYGCSPVASFQEQLRPVLALKSRVTLVRTIQAGCGVSYGRTFIAPQAMRVATLGIGYADGLPRSISNQGASVLIQGTRCAILGRVTMDQIVVDISHLDTVSSGEEAVIIGTQGNTSITVADVAAQAGTIPWEIFTRLQQRAALVYPESAI